MVMQMRDALATAAPAPVLAAQPAASTPDISPTFYQIEIGSFLAPGHAFDGTPGDTGGGGTPAFASGSIVGSAILSIGFVSWLLRSGVLASSMMATAPLWNRLDLLPILPDRRKKDQERDDDLQERVTTARDRRERALRKLFPGRPDAPPADVDNRTA